MTQGAYDSGEAVGPRLYGNAPNVTGIFVDELRAMARTPQRGGDESCANCEAHVTSAKFSPHSSYACTN